MRPALWPRLLLLVLLPAVPALVAVPETPRRPVHTVPRHSYDAALRWVEDRLTRIDAMTPPHSAILSASYYEGRFVVLRFRSTPMKRYLFEGVPFEVWTQWRRAPSKGGFYNAHIRGRYRFELQRPARR